MKKQSIITSIIVLIISVTAVSAITMNVDELKSLLGNEGMIGAITTETPSYLDDGEWTGFNDIFADDIETADDLTVGDDLAVLGAMSITGATTLTGTLTGDVNAGSLTYGQGILASSTANAAETLLIGNISGYSSLDYTPGNLAVTLTLPATSTMTSFITTAGECYDYRIRNLDATAATSTTIAAGAGMDLVENENGDVVIEGGNGAQLKFCREADTDVTVYVDEYIAAD